MSPIIYYGNAIPDAPDGPDADGDGFPDYIDYSPLISNPLDSNRNPIQYFDFYGK